jgi:hypothetical protein
MFGVGNWVRGSTLTTAGQNWLKLTLSFEAESFSY